MLKDNNEIWKPSPIFEDYYSISSLGRVKNSKGKILRTFIINSGYEAVILTKQGKRVHCLIHRLVAIAFIPNLNPSIYCEVNHKDESKLNNCLDNMEWVTPSENKQHSIKSGTYNKIFTMKNSLGKKHKSNVSKYHNVGFDKRRKKWTAGVFHNGKNWYQKRFNSEIEAALHVNWIIEKLGLTDRPKNIIV